MAANLERLYDELEGKSNQIASTAGDLNRSLSAFSNELRATLPFLDDFTRTVRETWFSISPGERTKAMRFWSRVAALVTVMEVHQHAGNELLNPELAKVYAKDFERFSAAVTVLGDLIKSNLAQEWAVTKGFGNETAEEAAAAKEALSGDIESLLGRTYTAEEFKQRFG
jgi:predicted YcjX-like family ATPase